MKTVIFDLDGTIIDSAPGFVEILNEILRERASPRRVTLGEVRQFASLGGPALVSGILARECGDLRQEVAGFRARYARYRTPIEALYEGVAEGIEELATEGYRLAICSNKPQQLCEKVLSDLNLARHFSAIVGSSPGRLNKPAPDLMELVFAGLGAAPADCLYVGDSEVDHALAQATGVRFAFVTYGYASDDFPTDELDRFDRFADLIRSLRDERTLARSAREAA